MSYNQPINIVILEDDDLNEQWIRSEIEDELSPKYQFTIETLRTECDFWKKFNNREFDSNRLTIFLLDVRVRWTKSGSNDPDPPIDWDYTDAGIRCYDAVKERYEGATAILFTVLRRPDLEHKLGSRAKDYQHVPKVEGTSALISKVMSYMDSIN